MKTRSELRDEIIKILYQIYILIDIKEPYDINELIEQEIGSKPSFVINTINDIILKQKDIEALANKYLKNWDINRLSKVDKAILSLGIYELMYTDTPSIVCINEAINLSKKYSDLEVVKMINATLDKIYKNEVNKQ